MKKLLALALLLTACSTVPPAPTPSTPEPDTVGHHEPATPPNASFKEIYDASKACHGHYFAERGYLPRGAVIGIMQSFASSLCRIRKGDADLDQSVLAVPASSHDVLALYNKRGATKEDRLRHVFTLMFGLTMRESNGNSTEGKDAHVPDAEQTSSTAEIGMYQFSYNLKGFNSVLPNLYARWKADPSQCNAATYIEGVPAKKNKMGAPPFGTGPGADFQTFARTCPAFQSDWVSVGLRFAVHHWGPAKRQEAEYVTACEEMLTKVEAATVCTL